MRRFFTKYRVPTIFLSLLVVLFTVPITTHAGVGFLPDWMTTGTTFFENFISSPIEIFLLPAASFVMFLGGKLMDYTINFGLHTAYIFSLSPAINLGWVIVRDICNIFFIFVLIYISLGTIVKGTSFGTKDLLTKVIIAAMLINFSLFVTKAVIDASNVFGLWLYGGVVKTLQVNSITGSETSISGLIATRLEVLQFGLSDAKPNANATKTTDPSQSFIGRLIRLAVVLIATYIFFYTSVLFISRSITLLFLMVFSPIGFMGGVLPQIKEYADDWKKELTAAAMFPIAYLLLLYISLQFINSLDLLKSGFSETVQNTGDFSIAQYFQYFIVIFMLQACLIIAKKNAGTMGNTLGGMAEGLAKFAVNAGVGIASGGTALLARAGVAGLVADKGKGAGAFKDTLRAGVPIVNRFGTGKSVWKDTQKALKEGSWDMRNAKIPGIGKETLSSTLGNLTGININTKTAKEYNDEKKEFTEEIKLEKTQIDLLAKIADLTAKRDKLEAIKLRTPLDKVAIKKAQDEVWTSQDSIAKTVGDLSNKQLEGLHRDNLVNPKVLEHMSESQIEYLSEKSALSDKDKASIRNTRLSGITSEIYDIDPITKKPKMDNSGKPIIKSPIDIKKLAEGIKKLSKREIENLPSEILSKAEFAQAFDSKKLETILESNTIGAGTKARIKANRYEKLKALIENPLTIGKSINNEISRLKMSSTEVAKLDKEFFVTATGVPDSVIDALVDRGNTDVFDKMISGEVSEELRKAIREDIKSKAATDPRLNKFVDWFSKGRGQAF